MFVEDQRKPLSPSSDAPKKAPFNWRSLPVEVLIQYRNEIRACLPPVSLAEMNMEEELLLQFHSLQALQNAVLNDDATPVNQRAQVANSVGTVLARLTELQMEIYSSERFKMIERLMIRALKKLPEDVAATFLDEYEAALQSLK